MPNPTYATSNRFAKEEIISMEYDPNIPCGSRVMCIFLRTDHDRTYVPYSLSLSAIEDLFF